jgi:Fe2+ or Zn2+ uptake regulation protein
VWNRVRRRFPHISRATVYNTLNLLVEHGLLIQLVLTEGRTVFDPNVHRHHHFVDEDTGEICDIPWETMRVSGVTKLDEFDVTDYQVVMRGKRTRKAKKKRR